MPDNKKLPDFLKSGEKARLIPVLPERQKEGRATSIMLANLSAVHDFSEKIFDSINRRIGNRTVIDTYTEIVFKDDDVAAGKKRPDGLIIVKTSKNSQWTALVEAKIDNAELDSDQIKTYLALAKKHGIDAVITISNQYSAIPTHHPISFSKSELKGRDLYHWSWRRVVAEAKLTLNDMGAEKSDQHFILAEMLRYFEHEKTGVSGFTRMNKEWKTVVDKIQNGVSLSKASDEVKNTVNSWHQESRDLSLIMGSELGVSVGLKLSRDHKKNQASRLQDDCNRLVSDHELTCELDIPNAASPLEITADLKGKTVKCSMGVDAPTNKQRGTARVNWLARQLKGISPEQASEIHIKSIIKGRGDNPQNTLAEIRAESMIIDFVPIAFEVIIVSNLAGKFSGNQTFIEHLEKAVHAFYETVGQNLQQPPKSAPKIKPDDSEESEAVESQQEGVSG